MWAAKKIFEDSVQSMGGYSLFPIFMLMINSCNFKFKDHIFLSDTVHTPFLTIFAQCSLKEGLQSQVKTVGLNSTIEPFHF